MNKKGENTQFLKHPLVISLIGIFLGSIIIPLIGSLYSDYRYRIDKKNEIAFDVIEYNQLAVSKLNNVLTGIEIFVKDSLLFVNRDEIRVFQIKESKKISDLYLKFNENSWHWNMSVLSKIKTLNYTETEIDSIETLLRKHSSNLGQQTDLINQFWTISLRKEFDSEKVHLFESGIRKEYDRLEEINNELIFKLAYFIKNK